MSPQVGTGQSQAVAEATQPFLAFCSNRPRGGGVVALVRPDRGSRRCLDRRARRRGPRDHRRERRRQVDADEDAQRASRAHPWRDQARRFAGRAEGPGRRGAARHRSGSPGDHARAGPVDRRKHVSRARAAPRTCGRRQGDEPARGRGDARVRGRGAGDRSGAAFVDRATPARADRPGARRSASRRNLRRADGVADTGRNDRAAQTDPGAQGEACRRPLHFPPAGGGQSRRRRR